MRAKKFTLLFLGTLVFIFILNAVAVYYSYSTREYFEYDKGAASRDIIIEADKYLSGLKIKDYKKVSYNFSKEYIDLGKNIRALKRLSDSKEKYQYYKEFSEQEAKKVVDKVNMTESQTQRRMRFIEYCTSRLDYAMGYSEYISGITERADKIKDISIFRDDIDDRVDATSDAFLRMKNLEIRATSDEGINMAYSDLMTDLFVCATAVFCAFFYSKRCMTGISENLAVKLRFFRFSVLVAVTVIIIYASNLYIADTAFSIGDFYRPLQSIKKFQICTYMLSVETFSEIRILFKTAAVMTVFYIFTGLFSSRKRGIPLVILVLGFSEEFIRHMNGSVLDIFAMLKAENVIGTYRMYTVFGHQVRTIGIFLLFAAAVLGVSVWFAYKSLDTSVIEAAEVAEKAYFEEVNNKYNESRMIRHDIKNHLSVISVLLDAGDVEGAKNYIGEITDDLDSTCPPVRTGSNGLDALLLKKYSHASDKKIKIKTEFMSDFSDCRFTGYDLCGIFSNILDNACEACDRLEEEDRVISLTVKDQMNMVCIFCENKYDEINLSPAGIITLKPDKVAHGFGLKRISRIAAKYGGTVDIKTDNNIFTISVLLTR